MAFHLVGLGTRMGAQCLMSAAAIEISTRRIVEELAANWPWWPKYQAAADRALAFTSGP